MVRVREMAGPQEQTRTKKPSASSMVLLFCSSPGFHLCSHCRGLLTLWSVYRVEKTVSSNSLVCTSPGEDGSLFSLNPNSHPWQWVWLSWEQAATPVTKRVASVFRNMAFITVTIWVSGPWAQFLEGGIFYLSHISLLWTFEPRGIWCGPFTHLQALLFSSFSTQPG